MHALSLPPSLPLFLSFTLLLLAWVRKSHTHTHTHTHTLTILPPPSYPLSLSLSFYVPCLGTKIRYDDELLEHILGEDVSEPRLLYVVRGHIDVVGSQVQVGGRDGSHSPLRLGGESLPLIVAGRGDDDFVPVFVDGACGGGRELRLFLRLLLNFGNLLPLLRRSRDLHAQDDVPNL